jgi:hypothetical protein
MHDTAANTVAWGDDGCFVLQNGGNGIALNVEYYWRGEPPHTDSTVRYFASVSPGQKSKMPEPMNVYGCSGECALVFEFDSIGRVRYQSVVSLNHHVITRFQFNRQRTANEKKSR